MKAKGMLFAWGILSASQLMAQNSDDKASAGPKTAESAANANPGRIPLDCLSYMNNPESAAFVWGGSKIYFVGKKPAKDSTNGNAVFYEVDQESGYYKKIIAFKAQADTLLIRHGRPNVEAVTLVNLPAEALPCREGYASGFGVRWNKVKKSFPTFAASQYKIIASDGGAMLADMDRNIIEILDASTQQRRVLSSFGPELIPLYVRHTPISLIAFNSKAKELQRYENFQKEAGSVLRIKPEMRLIQQNEKFGIVTAKNAGRTLHVAQIKGWSGPDFRVFDLLLPAGWDEKRSEILVDFASGFTYVVGANQAARKELRSILEFDGPGGKLIKNLQAPQGSYFSQAALSPDGKQLAALVASLEDDSVQAIWIEGKGETQKIDLNRGNEVKGDEAAIPLPAAVPAQNTAVPATPADAGKAAPTPPPAKK